jgi:galacturonosyltransferase
MENKILILANSDAGLYNFRNELISILTNKGYEVVACTPVDTKEEELTNLGIRLIPINLDRRGINPITDLKLLKTYRKILAREKPNLVITYTIKPNVYGGFASRVTHTPYAVNITGLGTAFESGGILKSIVTIMNRVACKKAKVVFFENEENRRTFIREKIVKEEQTHRLNGAGVNIEKYQVSDYLKGDKINFLFMGRIMKEKGIDELFTAMRRLQKDGIKCSLDVLGHYEDDYKEKIEQYESEGWLRYYGYQKDVRPYINDCHCFVLPSWHEGMANTNLECAASGRPVITSNIHGCLEDVEEGVSGYLCESKNADDLYRVMKKFSQLSYEERKAMGLAGRKRMEKIFDRKKLVEETIKCLKLQEEVE